MDLKSSLIPGRLKYIIIGFLFFSFPFLVRAGFGVSPPKISEDHLVKGATIERTVYLVQGLPEKLINMEVFVESADIKEWFSFEPGKQFTIPSGVQQFPLKVIIKVPEDAELGIYKAQIRINTQAKEIEEGEGQQVSIALGARVDVDLEVGEGAFREYNVRNIDIKDIKAGGKPEVELVIDNTGNIPASPAGASFEVLNKFGDTRLSFIQIEDIPAVPAFSEKSINLKFPMSFYLAEGEYWGHVKIYNEDQKVIRELKTVFNVKPGLSKTVWFAIGAGVIILISLLILFLIKRKRKNAI